MVRSRDQETELSSSFFYKLDIFKSLSNITNVKKTVKIAEYIDDTWYHKGHWVDLNGDGLKDLLIPRANYKRGDGMLVWFENPGESALSDNEPWKEHIISEGPTYESSIDFLP